MIEETTKEMDKIETMLTYALFSDTKHDSSWKLKSRSSLFAEKDVGSVIGIMDMQPRYAYTFCLNGDRLYSADKSMLLTDQIEIIGDKSETIVMCEDVMKWAGVRRIKNPPKRVCALGKPYVWYEIHYRVIDLSGKCDYVKRIVALDKNGNGLFVSYNGIKISTQEDVSRMITMQASIIEDARSPGMVLAEVFADKAIAFPIKYHEYSGIFIERERPLTKLGRKKSIVHWVSEHIRQPEAKKDHVVKGHKRGIDQFEMDGMSIKVTVTERSKMTILEAPQ